MSHHYIKNRYDLLLGRFGRKVTEGPWLSFVWGPRGSGRTSVLLEDMEKSLNENPGTKAVFCIYRQRLFHFRKFNPSLKNRIRFITPTDICIGLRVDFVYIDNIDFMLSQIEVLWGTIISSKKTMVTSMKPMEKFFPKDVWKYVRLSDSG